MTEELLHFIQNEKNEAMEFIQNAQKWCDEGSYDVYLYGAGATLPALVRIMQRNSVEIKSILDTKKEGIYCGIPIIRYEAFLAGGPNLKRCQFLISAPSVSEEIKQKLLENVEASHIWNISIELYDELIPDLDDYRTYLVNHWNEFIALNDALEDNKSRETLEMVLRGRISAQVEYFQHCQAPDQYYPKDFLRLSKNEVMVELGSNDGETLREFIRLCPEYKCVYCFEPDKSSLENLQIVQEEERKLGRQVQIIQKAAWDGSGTLEFVGEGKGSRMVNKNSNSATYTVESAAVDDEVQGPVTYIKMDVEGSEICALHGAHNLIVNYKPKLAVCVYHKITDILDVWNYLRSIVPEYRFYLRHHLSGGCETVLYAIS